MEEINKKDRIKGILGTILFHCILLAAFLFFGFRTPLPLPEEEGVEVRMGDVDGMGDLNVPPPPTNTPPAASKPEKTEEKNITQNSEEAPAIKQNTKEPKNETPVKNESTEKEVTKPVPTVDPTKMYGKSPNTSGQNSGETNKPGYQGGTHGNPNATNPIGGGTGDGISYNLGTRKAKSLPAPPRTFSVSGTVVVDITVDKDGKVINAIPGARGTTTQDETLRRLAKEAALKASFDPDLKSIEQTGTITYIFKLQ